MLVTPMKSRVVYSGLSAYVLGALPDSLTGRMCIISSAIRFKLMGKQLLASEETETLQDGKSSENKKVLVQGFLIDAIKFQTAQPVYMRLRPTALGSVILNTMSPAEGKDLLFDLLQCQLVIVPHTDKLFDLFVLLRQDMYLIVVVVSKTTCNERSVTFVRLYPFFSVGTAMVVGARITHFTLCAVRSRYSVNSRQPAS